MLAACDGADQAPAAAARDALPVPLSAASPADRPAFPALTGRVVDQADVLRPEDEARLAATIAALERRTTDQLVIVTVPSLGGRTIEDYSRTLGNHWRIGQADKDNGVLLVVAPQERQVRIAVGHGLEAILTNARASEIIDRDLLPAFRRSRWNEGISAGVDSIADTLLAHAHEPRLGRR